MGTKFGVMTYNTSIPLQSTFFARFVGNEFYEYWETVLEECKKLPVFHEPSRPTRVELEKSIYSVYKDLFSEANMF